MPTNKNLAALNERTGGMPLWEKYAFISMALAELSGQVDPKTFENAMDAACRFGIGAKKSAAKTLELVPHSDAGEATGRRGPQQLRQPVAIGNH